MIHRLAQVATVALLVSACTQPPSTLPSDVKDPEALAVVANSIETDLFIASTATDELRVLTLNADPTTETYVEAPNPLYVLSIPVVSRPFAMVNDTDGTNPGSFIFVLSAVENRLGIVNAMDVDGGLTEIQEVPLPGTPVSLAARTQAGGGARVFIGMSAGTHGSIITVDVPAPSSLPATVVTSGTALSTPAIVLNPSYADLETAEPVALAISPDGTTLAIGDQIADESNPDPTQRRGGVLFADISDPLGTQPASLHRVNVGGGVRKLVFSGITTQFVDGGGPIAAGVFLYAVLTNTGCPLGQQCGGVQTLINGSVPESLPGVPWAPIVVPGEATDVSVGAGPVLNLPAEAGMGGAICVPLLLTIPATDGRLYFADGIKGSLYNVNELRPSVLTGITHYDSFGNPVLPDAGDDGTGPSNIQLTQGGIQSGTVVVTYLGVLPVLSNRPASLTGTLLTDSAVVFSSLGVEVGDWVTLSSTDSSCAPTLVNVAALGTAGGALGATQLQLSGTFTCDGPTLYSVAAGPGSTDPYLVASSQQGFLGRTHPGGQFQSSAAYFFRPPGFDPTVPGLVFQMGPGATMLTDGGGPNQGQSWTFLVDSAVSPMAVLGGIDGLVPGPATWVQSLANFFVGYPGSNLGSEVVQFDPSTVVYLTDTNVTEWE